MDEAKNISLNQEQQDDKSYQGLIASILGNLGSLLRKVLAGALETTGAAVSNVPKSIGDALKGLSEDGLNGLLSGLIRGLHATIISNSAGATIGGLTGERIK